MRIPSALLHVRGWALGANGQLTSKISAVVDGIVRIYITNSMVVRDPTSQPPSNGQVPKRPRDGFIPGQFHAHARHASTTARHRVFGLGTRPNWPMLVLPVFIGIQSIGPRRLRLSQRITHRSERDACVYLVASSVRIAKSSERRVRLTL